MASQTELTPDAPSPDLRRRFTRLAALNVLSNLTVPLASLVDTALLGHLEDLRFLAGVALAAVLFEYLYWSFGFLRMGTTGTTAQAVGAGDEVEVRRVLYRSLAIAAGLGAAVLLLQVPLRELGFALLAGAPEVEAAGRDYFGARIWAAPATLANFVLLGWFLGREEGGRVLLLTAVANLANIGLDYVFIVRLGRAAAGAGEATALSQYLALAAGLALLARTPGAAAGGWREVFRGDRLAALVRLNRDLLIRTVALISAFAIFLNFSAVLGTVVLAANAILHRLVMLAAYLIDGAAFATETLAGTLAGAGRGRELGRLVRLAVGAGLACTVPLLAALAVAPQAALGLLTSHPGALDVALRHLPWLLPVLLLGALAFILDGVFLGLTAGPTLRDALLLGTLAGFLPVALLGLALRQNDLLWLAMTLFMLVRAAYLGRRALSLGTVLAGRPR